VILTLYGRAWCHLCDDMLAALEPLRAEAGFEVRVVDVDTDPALEEKYGERVPVLCDAQGEICHYFLDSAAVRARIGKIG
jgi:thiol-disulfide isomerase/thioredoxin